MNVNSGSKENSNFSLFIQYIWLFLKCCPKNKDFLVYQGCVYTLIKKHIHITPRYGITICGSHISKLNRAGTELATPCAGVCYVNAVVVFFPSIRHTFRPSSTEIEILDSSKKLYLNKIMFFTIKMIFVFDGRLS